LLAKGREKGPVREKKGGRQARRRTTNTEAVEERVTHGGFGGITGNYIVGDRRGHHLEGGKNGF